MESLNIFYALLGLAIGWLTAEGFHKIFKCSCRRRYTKSGTRSANLVIRADGSGRAA